MLFLSRKFLKIFLKNIGVNNSIPDESGDFPPTFMIKGSFNIDKYAAISGGRLSGWIYKIRYNDSSTFADNQESIAGESCILLKTIPALFSISL